MNEEELCEFFDARDQFLGTATLSLDIKGGFSRLSKSKHPEAVYVTSLFPTPPKNVFDVLDRLKECGDHPIALYHLGCLTGEREMFVRAAMLGHPGAMYRFGRTCQYRSDERRSWLEKAAMADERGSLLYYASYIENSREKNRMILRGAQLGDPEAMMACADMYDESDARRYDWIKRALMRGVYPDWVRLLRNADAPSVTSYLIGKTFGSLMSVIATSPYIQDRLLNCTHVFYNWNRDARESVMCWMGVAKRLGLYRDVARLIGERTWALRSRWKEE